MEADKKICLDYYERELAQWGEDIRALWGSTESQQERFQVLWGIGDFVGKSVLDVGCGFGDFYDFMHGQGMMHRRYMGIDISEKMIAIARKKYPDTTFVVGDIMTAPLKKAGFDFVIASGIFPLATSQWAEITEDTLSRMYDLCRIGVGVNFLSSFTTGKKFADKHYADPGAMVDFVCRNISPRVVMRQDYRPNDFTLYIYKPSDKDVKE